ncbi:MAG: hypothetical protein QM749_13215 [Aquabacterium sp.]
MPAPTVKVQRAEPWKCVGIHLVDNPNLQACDVAERLKFVSQLRSIETVFIFAYCIEEGAVLDLKISTKGFIECLFDEVLGSAEEASELVPRPFCSRYA